MDAKENLLQIKKLNFALLIAFLAFMLSGFIPVRLIFLIPLFVLFLLGGWLIHKVNNTDLNSKLEQHLLYLGFSAVFLSIGVLNGVLSIMGFYPLPGFLFLLSTIIPMMIFIYAGLRSPFLFNREINRIELQKRKLKPLDYKIDY